MKKEDKDQSVLAIVIAVVVLAISLITFLISFFNRPFYTEELEIRFEVGETAGVNLDRTDLIDFGRISPESAAIGRMVELTNNKEFSVVVNTIFSEKIQDFFPPVKEEVIPPGESKNISVWLTVPSGTSQGNYSGTVKFVFQVNKG